MDPRRMRADLPWRSVGGVKGGKVGAFFPHIYILLPSPPHTPKGMVGSPLGAETPPFMASPVIKGLVLKGLLHSAVPLGWTLMHRPNGWQAPWG